VQHKLVLALIVLVYLLIGGLYAVKTPDWQVPDEPAHYNYIRQLAGEGRLPILEMGDYDQDYLGRLTSERFPPELSLDAVEYEDWQPPLYYLLTAPVFLLFDRALLPLRLFSLLLGAGVVLLAFAVAATVFPNRPLVALGTAAFVAFLPQHVAMMAGVNNDSLTELLVATALLLVLLWLRDGQRGAREWLWLLTMGVVLGLGLVTKASFLPIGLTMAFSILLAWWRDDDRTWRRLVGTLAWVFVPAAVIALPWWLRNVATYGGLDIYGMANHNAVVAEQPRTADWIETNGLVSWLERWVAFSFQSFWGQFGWMGVVMPTWLYRALGMWTMILAAGFLVWLRQARHDIHGGVQRTQLMVLAAVVMFVALTYVYYNSTFVQHQGRYLFPALIPISIGVALAIGGLLDVARVPAKLQPLAFAIPYAAMAALAVYALWRLIVPALA
jgi:4-amino-4-deoxy-L-arabinose transferase-like glycosyltransferase